MSVKETGIRKERAWIGWYSADVPLRQPFLFQNSSLSTGEVSLSQAL